MGCTVSSPRVHPAHKSPAVIDFDDLDENGVSIKQQQQAAAVEINLDEFFETSYLGILQGISKIPKTPTVEPVVCLTSNTLPLVLGTLYLNSGDSTNIDVPVAAIGVYGKGRTVALGHIGILAECHQSNTEASAFLENIARYACGNRMIYKVLILGLTANNANQIKKNLSFFEIYADISSSIENISKYSGIICTTEFTQSDEILNFVENGGGLICGFVEPMNLEEPYQYPMEDALYKLGYGFPECTLQISPNSQNSFKTELKYQKCKNVTFPELVESFIKMTSDPDSLNINELDSLVITLKYHIITLKREDNMYVRRLNEAAWDYLDKTDACTSKFKSVCPDLIHGITFVLISELMNHIPPYYFQGWDRSMPIPGKVGEKMLRRDSDASSNQSSYSDVSSSRKLGATKNINLNSTSNTNLCPVELADFKTHVLFHCASWVSTGLYLPAGVLATVKIDKLYPNLTVLIGSHIDSLLSNAPPWHRWPVVTNIYEFNKDTIDICSPFGGIIYITCEDFNYDTPDAKLEFDATFHNVTQHPSYIKFVENSYTDSRNMLIPWGELETEFVIFTMPTDKLDKISKLNFDEITQSLDTIIAKVLTFTSNESMRLFRVVFDVDIADGATGIGYPIYIEMGMLDSIFTKIDKPSSELLLLLTYIAMNSMPENIFEPLALLSFGLIAAIFAFESTFGKDCNAIQYVMNPPTKIFNSLYDLYTKLNGKTFQKAFAKAKEAGSYLQNPEPKKYWKVFVQKLTNGNQDAARQLLNESLEMDGTGGNMLITYPSNSLSEFQLTEAVVKDSLIIG